MSVMYFAKSTLYKPTAIEAMTFHTRGQHDSNYTTM